MGNKCRRADRGLECGGKRSATPLLLAVPGVGPKPKRRRRSALPAHSKSHRVVYPVDSSVSGRSDDVSWRVFGVVRGLKCRIEVHRSSENDSLQSPTESTFVPALRLLTW